MKTVGALISGLLFGLGLAVSGMIDPAVVLGFLDLGGIADGSWNPALAGVMGAAVPVAFVFYRLLPEKVPFIGGVVDRRLVLGSALFGLGWGLVGICPGPALEAWVADPFALFFILPMLAGLALTPLAVRRAARA